MMFKLNIENESAQIQISQSLNLLREIFKQDLLGVYLYVSAVLDGLQKYSDIDLFIVTNRATTHEEKIKLATALLKISGIYMKSKIFPIEMTIVKKSEINPWHYPPKFDFQYGEWLRQYFENGNCAPWSSKKMPDLAVLLTQVLLASSTLIGAKPEQLLPKVPYKDFIKATVETLPELISDLDNDTRNVLLTMARIWCTVATDRIYSKPAAANWVTNRLPQKYHPVMKRAKAQACGEEKERWDDIQELVKPCADFMLSKINQQICQIMSSNNVNRFIKITSHQ